MKLEKTYQYDSRDFNQKKSGNVTQGFCFIRLSGNPISLIQITIIISFCLGDLTDKGYQKRRSSLIAPFLIPGKF